MKTEITTILDRAGITRRHLDYLLTGERNASPATGNRLEKATGISKVVWVFGTAKERKAAWEKFIFGNKKNRRVAERRRACRKCKHA